MTEIKNPQTMSMLGFDLETTGVDTTTDRIVTASLVFTSGPVVGDVQDLLADPGVEIPEGATAVHGVTTEYAREHGRPAREVLFELRTALATAALTGTPIVGFNIAYDLSLLHAELHRHGLKLDPSKLVLDAHVIDKHVDPYRKGSRNLTNVAAHYGVTLDNAHNANADALAAVQVMVKIFEKYPHLTEMTLEELHARQVEWRADQASSLEAYLRRSKKDNSITIEKGWPLYETTPAA